MPKQLTLNFSQMSKELRKGDLFSSVRWHWRVESLSVE